MRIEFHNRATTGHNETKLRYNEGPDLLYRRRSAPDKMEGGDMCFLASREIITLELTANEEKALNSDGALLIMGP